MTKNSSKIEKLIRLTEELGLYDQMVVVCVEHKTFIPCRKCDKTPASIPWSSNPEDISMVSKYQNSVGK